MRDSVILPTIFEQFKQIVYQSAQKHYGHISSASVEREFIDFELEVFSSIPGCMDYLLIIKGLVDAARENGIPVGPGYGASPASLVTYCLGITGIDPTANESLFDLYATIGQQEIPKITLDLGSGGTAFAYKYLQESLGSTHVARLMLSNSYLTNCHILFSMEPLTDRIPVQTGYSEGKEYQAINNDDLSFNGKEGIFLLTVFTNWNLDEIDEGLRLIKKQYGRDIRLDDIDWDDKETFALFSNSDTEGLPYYESARMRKYLRQLQPDRFYDLMVLNSLYVPSRMNLIPLYIERKHDGYLSNHNDTVEDILNETCGIIVYQEQLTLLTFRAFGISQFEIFPLINNVKEKNQEQLSILKDGFLKMARLKETSDEDFEMVWDCWSNHYGSIPYMADSICKTLTSYRKAWIKAHYRYEFQIARRIIARRRTLVNNKSEDPFNHNYQWKRPSSTASE